MELTEENTQGKKNLRGQFTLDKVIASSAPFLADGEQQLYRNVIKTRLEAWHRKRPFGVSAFEKAFSLQVCLRSYQEGIQAENYLAALFKRESPDDFILYFDSIRFK